MPRHNRRTQFVFFDGSERTHRVREIWGFQWHREWDSEAYKTLVQFPGWLGGN